MHAGQPKLNIYPVFKQDTKNYALVNEKFLCHLMVGRRHVGIMLTPLQMRIGNVCRIPS